MIQVEDMPEPKLRSERINETRHVRTFEREELIEKMRDIVLNEAGVREYDPKRSTATLDVMLDGLPEKVTVKVTVQERGY